MTDRECFKVAGEITLALYAGTVVGNLINLWRGRRRKHRIPLDRIDKLDPTQWRKVEWPTRSVAHETFTVAPTHWAVPPNWVEFAEELSIEEAKRRFPKPWPPIPYYQVESTDYPGLERSPNVQPPKGDE